MIKEIIDIEKFYKTNTLIDIDDKLPNYVTLKNIAIVITCVIKDDNKFYPQLLLEKELFVKWVWNPTRWCLQEDIKKEIEAIFAYKNKYKFGKRSGVVRW